MSHYSGLDICRMGIDWGEHDCYSFPRHIPREIDMDTDDNEDRASLDDDIDKWECFSDSN